ncbi:MAG: DUF11 domain-containing protein, partial [Anaerolineae bacterium]|nr:DUF11 domain-containing protein [Anaerolineae bacterium]
MKKITLYLPLALALGLLTVVLLLTSPTTAAPPDALTPIYDIQYTTDPGDGTYPSPYEGQLVTTTGVVYAVYGGGFMIADDSGPWHSIYVYYPVTPKPELGDLVEVVGTVQEYYGLTELANYATYTTLSSGNPIHLPSIVTAAEIPFDNPDISEPYESVLVEVQNIVVTEGADPYCTWTFSDASSGSAKADDWGYCIDPDVGDQFAILRGALIYTFDWYRVMPRDAGDVIQGPHIAVQFHAASNVAPGALLTYTLSAINNTTISLTQVTITDAIPLTNTALADILDGGVLIGDVISWTIPNLPNGDIASVQFVVTATGQVGDEIWNRNYAAWAANWPTATVGGPYVTIIGDYTPIYQIQGDSDASPYDGYQVTTVGVVVGFFEGNLPDGGQFDGFFIQDPAGDGITTTSDGLFVNHGTLGVSVAAGDRVTVTGLVQEFSEWDGTACAYDCLTQIGVGSAGDVQPSITGTVAATLLDPPGDPDAAHIYWEALEGMLVSLPVTGAVVAPTNYGTIQVIPGDAGYDRALRGGPVEGMPVGVRHWKRFGEMGGGDPPSLIVGSVVTDVDGPLAYSYGSFLVATQPGGRWGVVYSQPLPAPPPSWLPAENSEFTLLSFNVENFFDTVNDPGKDDPVISPVNYAIHRDKIAATIAQAGCPTFVGLQEVEKLAVLQDVAAVLSTTYGCAYSAVLSEGLDGRGIDVGYLLDSRVTVDGLAQYQDCTEYDTGLGQGDCPEGQQMLYSRIPLVLTATVQMEPEPLQVVLIVNHLKSKL